MIIKLIVSTLPYSTPWLYDTCGLYGCRAPVVLWGTGAELIYTLCVVDGRYSCKTVDWGMESSCISTDIQYIPWNIDTARLYCPCIIILLWKIVLLHFKEFTNHNGILHIPRQHSCLGLCNISLWFNWYGRKFKQSYIHQILNLINKISLVEWNEFLLIDYISTLYSSPVFAWYMGSVWM